MIKSTNLKVAFAHLTSRVKQGLVAMLSVTFGISMYIFMNGFMTGVNDIQNELAFSTLAHVRIFNDLPEDKSNLLASSVDQDHLIHIRSPRVIQYTEGIRNADKIVKQVTQFPEVIGVTSQVNLNVFFRNGATKANGVLSGIEAVKENQLFGTAETLVEGNWSELDHRGDGIILGLGLAKKAQCECK